MSFLPSISNKEKKMIVKLYTESDLEGDGLVELIKEKIDKIRVKANRPKVAAKLIAKAVGDIEKVIDDVGRHKIKDSYDRRRYLEKRYAELTCKFRSYPTLAQMDKMGITRARIRVTHANLEELRVESKKNFPTYFDRVHEFKGILNDINRAWIKKTVKNNDLFTVFGVTSAPIDMDRLEVALNFHKIEGGYPIFVPMSRRIEDIDDVIIELFKKRKCIIALEDIEINDNLVIRYVNQNEKAINVLTGFSRTAPSKSVIFAGIAQRVNVLPSKKKGHPRMLMSTGVITVNHHRSSINHNHGAHTPSVIKAEDKHFSGGFLIEKINDRLFIPTQIQMPQKKEFTVYGRRYTSNKLTYSKPLACVLGDLHDDEKDTRILKDTLNYSYNLGTPKLFLHDIFNCTSGSHWNDGKLCLKSFHKVKGLSSLSKEMLSLVETLNTISKHFEVEVVDSNHDDMLRRALDSGKLLKDTENAPVAALLLPAAIFSFFEREEEGLDIPGKVEDSLGISRENFMKYFGYLKNAPRLLEFATNLFGVKRPDKINWMDLESSAIVAGFELACHGHNGANGAKGSLIAFASNLEKSITGHTHTPGQENFNIAVGHCVDIRPGKRPVYVLGGLSGWVFANAEIHKDGGAHHIFNVMGYRSRFLDKEVLKNLTGKGAIKPLRKIKNKIERRSVFEVYEDGDIGIAA